MGVIVDSGPGKNVLLVKVLSLYGIPTKHLFSSLGINTF